MTDLRINFLDALSGLRDAGKSEQEAEIEAARITVVLGRNLSCPWSDLRRALSDRPAILARLPATEGTVDSLPLGTPNYAVRIDGVVRRQGIFTGNDVEGPV